VRRPRVSDPVAVCNFHHGRRDGTVPVHTCGHVVADRPGVGGSGDHGRHLVPGGEPACCCNDRS